MDIENLSLFLDNDKTYNSNTKSHFINKLKDIFRAFKSHSDSELGQIPSFSESDAFKMVDCKKFTFIGNVSASYITLIFEEQDIIVSNNLNSWTSEGKYIPPTFFNRYSLIKKSEIDVSTGSTIDHLIKVEKCKDALNEICSNEITFLHKDNYISWLAKHAYLKDEHYSFVFYPHQQFEKFNNLYFWLSEFKFYINLTPECIKANEEFNLIDISNQNEIDDWMNNVKDLGNQIFSITETSLNKDENEEEFQTGFVTVHEDLQIKIATSDFTDVLEFLDNYFRYIV